MELRFLGTSGSQPIPLPFCDCDRCEQARERGPPYERRGYSMHLPGLNAMVDASEFAAANANRWSVPTLDYLFLTHWHADHAHGLRLLSMRPAEARGGESFVEAKRRTAPTIVTTRAVYERLRSDLGTAEYLVERRGWADVHFLDEEPFDRRGFRVEAVPYPLTEGGPKDATGFVFRADGRSLAIVSDDAAHLDEERLPGELDAVVFEGGTFTHGPNGERLRPDGVSSDDVTHEEVRQRIERVDPDRAFLSHVGHHAARSHDDLQSLEADYDRTRFAYDGLDVTI